MPGTIPNEIVFTTLLIELFIYLSRAVSRFGMHCVFGEPGVGYAAQGRLDGGVRTEAQPAEVDERQSPARSQRMKIISETKDELILKEGSTSGIITGTLFLLAGIGVGVFRGSIAASISSASGPKIVLGISAALFLIGLLAILLSSAITVGVNKTTGKLSYEKKRLVGGSSTTYGIDEVLRIETRRQWQMQNAAATQNQGGTVQQPILVAQSVIVFKDGREVALDHQKNSSSTSVGGAVIMSGQGREVALANRVATFMGVPFQEISPPNMGMGVNIMGPGGSAQI